MFEKNHFKILCILLQKEELPEDNDEYNYDDEEFEVMLL